MTEQHSTPIAWEPDMYPLGSDQPSWSVCSAIVRRDPPAQLSVVVVRLFEIVEYPFGHRHSARGGRFVDWVGSVPHLFVLLG